MTLGKKRLTKAIERTTTWFQTLSSALKKIYGETGRQPFLFGVAQYDHTYPVQLPTLVKHMLSQGAQGISTFRYNLFRLAVDCATVEIEIVCVL